MNENTDATHSESPEQTGNVFGRDHQGDLAKLADAFFLNLERETGCEYGGWGLDDKRPFGNSSVAEDILEIIEWEPAVDDYYSEAQTDYAHGLYDELCDYLREQWAKRRLSPDVKNTSGVSVSAESECQD